jgi:hypothetical protein
MPRPVTFAVALAAAVAALGAGSGIASAYPAGEIFTYGSAGAGDTLLAATPGTSPSLAGVIDGGGSWELAYHALDGDVSVDGAAQTGSLGLAMRDGTSPAIIGLSGGGFETTFEFTNSDLADAGTAGTIIHHLGMSTATSPAIAHVAGGTYRDAFTANTNSVYTADATTDANLGEPATPGTDPAVAMDGADYVVAFQGSNHDLWQATADGATDDHRGMDAATSPAAAPLAGGGTQFAFQANTHLLWTFGAASSGSTGQPMSPGSTPAVTNLAGGGYEIAYVRSDGTLGLWGSAGNVDTGLAVEPGTRPGIGGLPQGGYEVAYAAPAPASAPSPAPAPAPPTPTPLTPRRSTTSVVGSGPRAFPGRVNLGWKWAGRRTVLERVRFTHLPRHATVTVSCRGRGCSTPRMRSGRRGHMRHLKRALIGRVFHPGQRLAIVARARGFRTLHAVIRIRRGRKPSLRV